MHSSPSPDIRDSPGGWLLSVFTDLKHCTMRDREELCAGTRKMQEQKYKLTEDVLAERDRAFPGPRNFDSRGALGRGAQRAACHTLPQDLYERLGELAMLDPQVAIRIVDDRKAPEIWGHTANNTTRFLQQCIRGDYIRAGELWWALQDLDRRDFMLAYQGGRGPRPDFFLNVLAPKSDFPDNGSLCSTRQESFSERSELEAQSDSWSSKPSSHNQPQVEVAFI